MNTKEYPGIFSRVKATIIDSVIIIVLMLAATDVFSNLENVPDYAKIIVFVGIFVLYDPLMVSVFGATIGHRLNKLKVQGLDHGKKINLGLAIVRFLIKSSLGWVSLVTVNKNALRQAIHDTAVKSIVVYDE